MIREFSEEKREELYNILDAIYSYTSAPFLTWCRGCDFGDWFEKLHIKSYTDKIVSYETSFSDINSRMRTQINNIFENIEKTDQTFSAMLEEIAGKVKEQLEHIQILQQVMNTANGGSGGLYTDENGKIVKIKIQDVGDGGYTLGFGIYISEDDQDRIALAESLGIKWNDLNYWVDIEDVNIMFSHVSPYYHNVEKGIERSTQKILTPQQYDAIFSLIYLRPKFQEKIIELINSNADKETWKKDLLYELESLPDYQRYPGWVDRIERTVDLYFDGIY